MGNVNVTGAIEVPMGITLREVIAIYAKGMKNDASFKLAQTGGSSGSLIPACLQDTPMDFEAFRRAGVSLGSGALLIADENTCVVECAPCICNPIIKISKNKCCSSEASTHSECSSGSSSSSSHHSHHHHHKKKVAVSKDVKSKKKSSKSKKR